MYDSSKRKCHARSNGEAIFTPDDSRLQIFTKSLDEPWILYDSSIRSIVVANYTIAQ